MSIMDIACRADGLVAVASGDGAYRSEARLKAACRALTAPHYDSFEGLFERDWAFCRSGYFIFSSGRLTGFILAEAHDVPSLGRSLFLGLSAGEADRIGRADTVKAYMLCLLDAAKREPPIGWAWGTTISPVIYAAVRTYLAGFAPLDGIEATPQQADAARRIIRDRQDWGWPAPDAEQPFVLRNVSRGVRYSNPEAQRLSAMRIKAPLLDAWKLSEEAGDRLVFVGRLPARDMIERLALRVLRGCAVIAPGVT